MPLIGLLSDSHGRAAITRRGVALLVDQGARVLVHLGDIEAVEVIDALVVQGVESRLVFGNTDWETGDLARYAGGLGVTVDDPAGRLDVGGGRVLVYTHGHHRGVVTEALSERVAYLCHGHTHERRDERVGPTRVINPGALFRAATHTVALLDTDKDELSFHRVEADG